MVFFISLVKNFLSVLEERFNLLENCLFCKKFLCSLVIKYCEDFREYLVLVISGYLFVTFQINFNYEHVSNFDTFTVNITKFSKLSLF